MDLYNNTSVRRRAIPCFVGLRNLIYIPRNPIGYRGLPVKVLGIGKSEKAFARKRRYPGELHRVTKQQTDIVKAPLEHGSKVENIFVF